MALKVRTNEQAYCAPSQPQACVDTQVNETVFRLVEAVVSFR